MSRRLRPGDSVNDKYAAIIDGPALALRVLARVIDPARDGFLLARDAVLFGALRR